MTRKFSVLAELSKGGTQGRTHGDELAAFLLARYDEADPNRESATVQAQRRIVAAWRHLPARREKYVHHSALVVSHVFGCLAEPFADHPDYRPEWAN